MTSRYAVLPCNGLDKSVGCITREIALGLVEKSETDLICPVMFRVSDARYTKIAADKPLLVLDGCATRCASKLAAEKGLKVAKKITVTEEAKNRKVAVGKSLKLGDSDLRLAEAVVEELLKEEKPKESPAGQDFSTIVYDYETYKKDKFIFRVPRSGFYFNENDCWVIVSGNRARVGVADFVQQSLSDIMFFTPPAVGAEIEQFGELGSIESGKAVFEVISPVSGVVTAVNDELISAPELLNENPYEKGWIAELELTDFDEDKELLLDFEGYFKVLKRKVDEFHVK